MTLAVDVQSLELTAIVELFELDATIAGGGVSYFHAGTNGLGTPVVWQGNSYLPLPVEAEGFDVSASGEEPRPVLRVANIDGLFSLELRMLDDLIGARVTRRRTLAKYLDAVNFAGGVNPSADPDQHWPDDVFLVNRKAVENESIIEFELGSPAEVRGAMLPAWQIIGSLCRWRQMGLYKDPDTCGWGGPATAGADFTATAGTLTIAAGNTVAAVQIPLTVDSVPEQAERLSLGLSNPVGAALSATVASVLITEQPVTPSMSLSAAAAEPGQVANFILSLDAPAVDDVVLEVERILGADAGAADVSSPEVSINGGVDWFPMGALVSVPTGSDAFKMRFLAVSDSVVETGWERIRLAASATASPTDAEGVGTIVDAGSGRYIWIEDAVVSDDAGFATVRVHVTEQRFNESGQPQPFLCKVFLLGHYDGGGFSAWPDIDYPATGGADINPITGAVNPSGVVEDDPDPVYLSVGGLAPATIRINLLNRSGNIGPRTLGIKVVPLEGPTVVKMARAIGTLTIVDAVPDESAAPRVIAVSSPATAEGGYLVFDVWLSHAGDAPVGVLVSKKAGLARVGDSLYALLDWTDYGYASSTPGSWTPVANWQPVPSNKRVTIPAGGSFVALRCAVPAGTPADQGYGIPVGAKLVDGTLNNAEVVAQAAVISDLPQPSIVPVPLSTTEASGWATVLITLSHPASGSVSLNYTTAGAGVYYDRNDLPTTDPTKDDCPGKMRSCALRFGPFPLRFGNFPSARLVSR